MDLSKVRRVAVKVTFGAVLGYTDEGWDISFKPSYEEETVHELGDIVVGMIAKGGSIIITGVLKEWTPQFLSEALPFSTLEGGKVDFDFGVGDDLYDKAKAITLHPRHLADSNTSEDVVFYKAAVFGDVDVALKYTQTRSIPFQFRIFPDRDKVGTENNPWGTYGGV